MAGRPETDARLALCGEFGVDVWTGILAFLQFLRRCLHEHGEEMVCESEDYYGRE